MFIKKLRDILSFILNAEMFSFWKV